MRLRFLAAAILVMTATAVQAQRMYVTDELVITLRTGPSTQNSITANLRTGDAVEVLEQDAESGYTRVRVAESGEEGWVLSRYLMPQEAADQQLASTTQALAGARAELEALQTELAELRTRLADTQSALDAAELNNRSVNSELEDVRTASANALELRSQNESLRASNIELSAQIDALAAETNRLGNRNRQNWFVVGALVLAFGIVIGLVAPSLRPRRRSNW